MSNLFFTCLLVQDDLSSPELRKTEVNLHPGIGFSPDHGSSVLLAGGFTSISPDSGVPLSPTLQLNLDMTNASSKDLEEIACAELDRYNSVNYRSYAIEANKRVCIVSSDSRQLQNFLDIYGGLLVVVPLLTTGYSQEFSTALDLKIGQGKNGCRLEYQVQSPIHIDVCTYCGDCGPACSEKCISEDLFVDLSKCTFCKECEKVCKADAIDIHSAVMEVLDIPTVILLGGLELEASDGVSNIFSEQDLPKYLASLYPCQVDEVVSCDNSICQYSSRLGFGCMICQVSCQYGAITTDGDGIHIDGLKCEECGACVSACPTGALQNERFDDHSFFTYFRKINLPADGTVVLGTEKSLHSLWWWQKNRTFEDTFFLQYENIQSLSLFHFVHLLDCGARSVLVLTDESGENSELEKQIELANKIIAGLFDTDIAVTQSSVDQFIDVVQIETPESFGCSSDITRSFINRRQALAKSLKGLMVRSGKETSFTAENGPLGFTNVSCDAEKCTHCMACLNECQIGAMVADEEHFILGHLGIMCVGCKICVRVCPENALSISSDVTINTSFFSSTELAKADPMQCKKCGKVFGTKKSFERVMAILSSKEAVDTNHFEYCETCRVINLFEAE